MDRFLVPVIAAAALAALTPAANAAWVSISDYNEAVPLQLQVNSGISGVAYQSATSADITKAGTGTFINSGNAATFGISNLVTTSTGGPDPATETMSFTFADQINWGSSVFWYRYFTGSSDVTGTNPNGYSDLMVIQGQIGTAPDNVTVISSNDLTGNIAADSATFGITNMFGAPPTQFGTVSEDPGWVLGADTGVDQYYLNSVPEPVTLAVLGTGLAALGAVRRRRRTAQ